MAITVLNIAEGALRLLGRPAELDLRFQDVIDTSRDVYRGMLLDLKLSRKNHTPLFSNWHTPTAEEGVNLTAFGLSASVTNIIPVKVEWRPKDSDAKPLTVTVTAFEHISDLYRKAITNDETYIAFHNGNKVSFSEKQDVLNNREYRIVYEDTEDVTFQTVGHSSSEFPDLILPYMQHKTAILALDIVRNNSDEWVERRERLRASLVPSLAEWDARFQKWQRTWYGNRKVRKLGFRSRRRW